MSTYTSTQSTSSKSAKPLAPRVDLNSLAEQTPAMSNPLAQHAQGQEIRGQGCLSAPEESTEPGAGATVQMYALPSALQARDLRAAGQPEAIKQAAALGVSGSAGPLPYQQHMEQLFGAEQLGGIQAHTGNEAGEACQAMGARAYTTGDHIAFKGNPDLSTVAHETAHVVQQRQGVQLPGGVGRPGDTYERQADAVAGAAMRGQPIKGALSPSAASGSTMDAVQAEPETTPDPLAGLPALSKAQIADSIAYNKLKLSKEAIQQIRGFLKCSNTSLATPDAEFARRVAGFQQSFTAVSGKVNVKTLEAIVNTGLEVNLIRPEQMAVARAKNLLLPLPLFFRIEEALGLPKDGRVSDRFIHRMGVFQRIYTPSPPDGWASANGTTVQCLIAQRGLTLEGLTKGEHADYRRMLEDGVFDITIGGGYDENNLDAGGFTMGPEGKYYTGEGKQLEAGISGLSFASSSQAELQKVINDAGAKRTIPAGMKYFIKRNHFQYAGRPVHITLTYVPPRQASGAERSAAFLSGLAESDGAIYFGHGRYQTGPDFDRNFTIQLKDKTGAWNNFPMYDEVDEHFKDQLNPEKKNSTEAKEFREKYGPFTGGTPLAMLQAMKANGRFKLITSNDGNLMINPRENAGGDFGLWLISQALNDATAGAKKELISPTNIKDDRYRLWVFSGCNTIGYVKGIRKYAQKAGGGAFSTQNLDLLVTNTETWVILGAEHAIAYLSGLMNMESVQAIAKRIEANVDKPFAPDLKEKKGTLQGQGFGGNPTL